MNGLYDVLETFTVATQSIAASARVFFCAAQHFSLAPGGASFYTRLVQRGEQNEAYSPRRDETLKVTAFL